MMVFPLALFILAWCLTVSGQYNNIVILLLTMVNAMLLYMEVG